MSTETLLSLILIVVTAVLVIALVAAVGLAAAALKWQRSRGRGIPGLSILGRRRRAPAPSPQPSAAAQPTPQTPATRPVARESGPTPRGDAPADHPRILELGLEEPASCDAVLRNLERIKPLLHQEAPEGDRMGRVTPLAGRALRSAGLFRWGFPQERGGLSASFAERLEAITQLARVDVGTAWVTTWLSAHGDIAGRLTDEAFAEIYPHADLPTAFSATPLARAVEVEGDRYRLDEGTTWRLGSGGYHAERWIGGAMVWDTNGEPVICEQTGEQKIIGVWLPPEKVRQLDDWDPLGVRSSGSASYRLTETIEVPRRHSFNVGADRRPYFFSFMGVMVGAAEHLVDLTMTALRAKSAKGAPIGFHDTARLTQAMASLDMMVIGLRGYAAHIDRIAASSDSGAPSVADTAWIESVGMPVRQAVLEISDIATDIFGTGYVASGSEFGRVLRDIQVALAHWWFRLSDTQAPRGNRVRMMLEDPTVATVWDTPLAHGARTHVRKVSVAGGCTVRTAALGELTPDDFQRWRRLDARALEPVPYLSADYLQPGSAHWPAAASVRLLLVERDDEMQMVMPFRIMPLHPWLPLPVMSTWDLTLADETTRLFPILRDSDPAGALLAGLEGLAALGLPGLVDIVTVPAEGPTAALLRRTLEPQGRWDIRGRSAWPVAHMRTPPEPNRSGTFDTTPHHRSASTRRRARRAREALERRFGGELSLRDRGDDPQAVEDFLALQAAGWKGDASKKGEAYQVTGRAEWLREVTDKFRSRGQLLALDVCAGDRSLYIMLCLRSGGSVCALQDAYDEAGAPHGLGSAARTGCLNWFAEQGIEAFDPNMFWGYSESARAYPDRREQLRLLLSAPGPVPTLQLAAVRAARNAGERLRALRSAASRRITPESAGAGPGDGGP